MRRNDIKQLHTLEKPDLVKKLADLRASLEQTRTEKVMGRLKNVKMVQELRKDIARVLTDLSRKGN